MKTSIIFICFYLMLAYTHSEEDTHYEMVYFQTPLDVTVCNFTSFQEVPPPELTYCRVPKKADFSASFRKEMEVWIHEKQNFVVTGYSCEKIQPIIHSNSFLFGGEQTIKYNKLEVSKQECDSAIFNDEVPQILNEPFTFLNKDIPKTPYIQKKPITVYVSSSDQLILPNANSHPDVKLGFYSDLNKLYVWDPNLLKKQFVKQGMFTCFGHKNEYICPGPKLVFHTLDRPKVIEIDNITLEKTEEGLYITTTKLKNTKDITDNATEDSYLNSLLEFEDRSEAVNAYLLNQLREVVHCYNKNSLITLSKPGDVIGPELYRVISGGFKAAAYIDKINWRLYPCIVTSVLGMKQGKVLKFVEKNTNRYLYYNEAGQCLTYTPNKFVKRKTIEVPEGLINTDSMTIVLKEPEIVVQVREEYKKDGYIEDVYIQHKTIATRMKEVYHRNGNMLEVAWNYISGCLEELWHVIILFCIVITGIVMLFIWRSSDGKPYKRVAPSAPSSSEAQFIHRERN